MYYAIKPVYDRKTRTYNVDLKSDPNGGAIIALAHVGYYVTDNLAALYGLIVAEKCDWYKRLNDAKRNVVSNWLRTHV